MNFKLLKIFCFLLTVHIHTHSHSQIANSSPDFCHFIINFYSKINHFLRAQFDLQILESDKFILGFRRRMKGCFTNFLLNMSRSYFQLSILPLLVKLARNTGPSICVLKVFI